MSDLEGPWGVTSTTVKNAADRGQMITGGYGYMNDSPSSSQPQSSGFTFQPLSTPQAAPTPVTHVSTGSHYSRGGSSQSVEQNYSSTYSGGYSDSSSGGGGALLLVGLMVLGGLGFVGYVFGPSKNATVSEARPSPPSRGSGSDFLTGAKNRRDAAAAPDGVLPVPPKAPPAPAAFVAPPGEPFDHKLYAPLGFSVVNISSLAGVRVTHKHKGRDCQGILEVTADRLRFLSSEREDAFNVPLSEVEKPEPSSDGKAFTVHIKDMQQGEHKKSKDFRFEPFKENAVPLAGFYTELVSTLDAFNPAAGEALAQR